MTLKGKAGQTFVVVLIVSIVFLLAVWASGRGRYDFNKAFQTINGVATITGVGTGALSDYDLCVGDTTTPDYGMIQFGDACIGRTSYNVGNVDLDGTLLIRNMSAPVTSKVELLFEDGSGNARFALASSGIGNATYNPRSMLIAGPAPQDTDFVTVGYWQTQGIFHNLVADTAGDGADLGVQNDLEVEGDIFTDSIKESTPDAGITFVGDINIGDAGGYSGVKFNATSTQLEFWIDGTQMGHIGTDGAYVDDI